MDLVFVVSVGWPAGEFLGAEPTDVAFGEAGRAVPDQAGGVFEGFGTAGADVGLVGAFRFVFAPFAGVDRGAVVEEGVFGVEGLGAFGETAVELIGGFRIFCWSGFWLLILGVVRSVEEMFGDGVFFGKDQVADRAVVHFVQGTSS